MLAEIRTAGEGVPTTTHDLGTDQVEIALIVGPDVLETLDHLSGDQDTAQYVAELVADAIRKATLARVAEEYKAAYGAPTDEEEREYDAMFQRAAQLGVGSSLTERSSKGTQTMAAKKATQLDTSSVGTLFLDSQGLSLLITTRQEGRDVQLLVAQAQARGQLVATAGVVLVEAHRPGGRASTARWKLAGVKVIDTDPEIIGEARALVDSTGIHGTKYTIDAIIAATAKIRCPRPVTLVTTDDDMKAFAEDFAEIRKV